VAVFAAAGVRMIGAIRHVMKRALFEKRRGSIGTAAFDRSGL